MRLRRRSAAAAAAAAAAAVISPYDHDGSNNEESDAASAHAGSEEALDSVASGIASDARSNSSSSSSSSVSLLSALAGDASLQRLQPLRLANLRSAVNALQHAIHSETVAHALTLYRYVRLQQKLIAVRRYKRKTAARKLNGWISAAYGQQWPDLFLRIKHDAHRLFDLCSEPADDDEWWPQLLEEIAAAHGRAKHLLVALLALDSHHVAIRQSYTKAHRLQLIRYYLLTQQWSARQIEQDLLQDGIIEAAPPPPLSFPSPSLLLQSPPPQLLQLQADEKAVQENNEGTCKSMWLRSSEV